MTSENARYMVNRNQLFERCLKALNVMAGDLHHCFAVPYPLLLLSYLNLFSSSVSV